MILLLLSLLLATDVEAAGSKNLCTKCQAKFEKPREEVQAVRDDALPLCEPKSVTQQPLGCTGWHKVCQLNLRNDSYFPYIDKHLVKAFVRSRVPGLAVARELRYFDSSAARFNSRRAVRRYSEAVRLGGGHTLVLKSTHMSGGVMLVQPNSTKCLKQPCRLGGKLSALGSGQLAPGRVVTGAAHSRAAQLASCRHWIKLSYGEKTSKELNSEFKADERVLYSRVAPGCLLERAIGGLAEQRDMKLFVFGGRLAFVKVYAKRFQEPGTQKQDSGVNSEYDVSYFSYPSWTRLRMYESLALHPFAPQPRPPYLEAMVADAEALAAGFASVRVDFMAQASTYAFSELTFSHNGCGGGTFMPPALELLYGSLATTGLRLSDSSSLEEQRVKLIAELNRTHAWACNRKRVYILVSTLVLAHCET